MKSIYLSVLLIGLFINMNQTTAQQMIPADAGSTVKFAIKNFGLTTNGSFKGLAGKIVFNPSDLQHAIFEVSVAANTIETGNKSRDHHLRDDDYFDVANFPQIILRSEKIQSASANNTYLLDGVLTIKGISRKIQFPFTAQPGKEGTVFEGQFTINRLNYKVGSNSISLADNATIQLKVTAK
jgi:polyisoprenoid-binding protein YceI